MSCTIEFWPTGALGPGAKPDTFQVSDDDGARIMENLHHEGSISFTDEDGVLYRVYLGKYRYVRSAYNIPTYLPPTRS